MLLKVFMHKCGDVSYFSTRTIDNDKISLSTYPATCKREKASMSHLVIPWGKSILPNGYILPLNCYIVFSIHKITTGHQWVCLLPPFKLKHYGSCGAQRGWSFTRRHAKIMSLCLRMKQGLWMAQSSFARELWSNAFLCLYFNPFLMFVFYFHSFHLW